jgi:hypothetical protein
MEKRFELFNLIDNFSMNLQNKLSVLTQMSMNGITSMLALKVRQDVDRRVDTEAMKILDELFNEEMEVFSQFDRK